MRRGILECRQATFGKILRAVFNVENGSDVFSMFAERAELIGAPKSSDQLQQSLPLPAIVGRPDESYHILEGFVLIRLILIEQDLQTPRGALFLRLTAWVPRYRRILPKKRKGGRGSLVVFRGPRLSGLQPGGSRYGS